MKLTSNWSSGSLFWRTFDRRDTVYIIGLREGFLSNGQTATYEHPSGIFQMEIKRDGLFGSTLVAAGHVFNNDDEYLITNDGQLIRVEDAAIVVVDPKVKFEPFGKVVQFFSTGSADSTIEIVSSIAQTTTTGGARQTTLSNSATDENGAVLEVEGTVDLGMLKGVKVTPTLSNKVTAKIERVVTEQMNQTVSAVTAYSEKQNITLKASKLTAVVSSWQRKFVTGTVTLGPNTFPYDATLGYMTSRQVSEYVSPTDLPPELAEAFRAQNPGHMPPTSRASLRSLNYPDRYMRHANFLGELTPIFSALDKSDATFNMVPGLAQADGVSFESVNYPQHYLRHENFRLKLQRRSGDALFDNDATFRQVPGLADAQGVSFESVNFPTLFIRHSNFHLLLEGRGPSENLFRRDATFLVSPPFVPAS